jgi:hypothetical protein
MKEEARSQPSRNAVKQRFQIESKKNCRKGREGEGSKMAERQEDI